MFREPLVRSRSPQDESVRDFFIRRIGQQAHDRLVAPAVTGIYAADAARLSMAAVFPKIVEMERAHGSLMKAFVKTLSGRSKPAGQPQRRPKGSVFSFSEGVETLPKRLAEKLCIRYNVPDARIGDAPVTVLAVPAPDAAELVETANTGLAAMFRKVEYAPMAIAAVSVPGDAFKQPLRGFGFLVPRNQDLHLLGALFSSALFADRAPEGQELFTCFLGGMFEPDALDWPDERIWEVACSELQRALQIPEMPRPVALFRQRRAIPQYNIGHERWVAAVKQELQRTPGLFIAANYLEGVSVPACIDQGARTARAVGEYLERKS
jgi:oxygen-dependent protoporphyrinogen oxidase